MNPILFQLSGSLAGGRYLPGEYLWSTPVVLTRAQIKCDVLPSAGVLTLTLEVGGVLTAYVLTVTPSGIAACSLPLAVTVPANTLVRWKASFTDSAENAAVGVAIVVYPSLPSLAPAPVLTVGWINGSESLTLFNYDAGTKQFTEAAPGISSGRAAIVQNYSGIDFFILGDWAMSVVGGIFYVDDFDVEGVQTVETPRLQFKVNGVTVATLTLTGLHLSDLDEGTPAILGVAEFDFYCGGVLAAVMSGTVLVASQLAEGIPP